MRVAGLIGGSLPDGGTTDPIVTTNIADLPELTGVDLLAVIPAGAGNLGGAAFTAAAPGWFGAAGRRFLSSASAASASAPASTAPAGAPASTAPAGATGESGTAAGVL